MSSCISGFNSLDATNPVKRNESLQTLPNVSLGAKSLPFDNHCLSGVIKPGEELIMPRIKRLTELAEGDPPLQLASVKLRRQ